MGRIKTLLVKRVAKRLFKDHSEELSEKFDKNKEIVEKYTNVSSKKIRNIISGYASRLVRQKIILEKEPRRRHHEEDLSRFYQ